MGKAMKRFIVRLALVAAILLASYAGWKWGDSVFPRVEAALGIAPSEAFGVIEVIEEVSPQAADRAMERIQAFRDSRAAELRLKPFEVSSLLRYSLPDVLPTGILDPAVEMDGDRFELTAGVLRSALPDLPGIGGIARMLLPDTVPVVAAGTLAPFDDRGSMLLVSEIVVSGMSVPSSAYRDILAAVGREEEAGLPEAAMRLPAFEEITGAYIEGGELVLVRA